MEKKLCLRDVLGLVSSAEVKVYVSVMYSDFENVIFDRQLYLEQDPDCLLHMTVVSIGIFDGTLNLLVGTCDEVMAWQE